MGPATTMVAAGLESETISVAASRWVVATARTIDIRPHVRLGRIRTSIAKSYRKGRVALIVTERSSMRSGPPYVECWSSIDRWCKVNHRGHRGHGGHRGAMRR